MDRRPARPFRSRDRFADPSRSDMTAPCLQRFPNHGRTPWEELYREKTVQLADGCVLEFATRYRGIAARTSRHDH